jgi:hypothetical protein
MSTARGLVVACVGVIAIALAGCADPDTLTAGSVREDTPANLGEPPAPRASSARAQRPASVSPSARGAVERFASLYATWDSRRLSAHERTLAALAVGPARLQASQAAVSARNGLLAKAHVWNRGEVVGVARDLDRRGWWLVITRERTGGRGEYESLPAGYHLTLALAVPVHGGWAVSQWWPQN